MNLVFKRALSALAIFATLGVAACSSTDDMGPRDPDEIPGHGADTDWKGVMPRPADPKNGHPLGVMDYDIGSYYVHTQRENGHDLHPELFRRGRVTELYFASDRDGSGYDIYRKVPSGNALTKITTTSGDEFWPTVSPDGRYLAFGSNKSGNWDICVMSLESWGTSPQVLTANSSGDDVHPTWSPDGSMLVYASYSDKLGEYVLRYLKFGEDMSTMSAPTGSNSMLVFSELPGSGSGAKMAMDSSMAMASGMLKVTEAGVLLSHQNTHITGTNPSFRPSKNRLEIAYQDFNKRGKGWSELKIYSLDDAGVRIVPIEGFGAIQPRWSPDGQNIVFTAIARDSASHSAQGGANLVITDPSGNSPRAIANPTDQHSISDPLWFNDMGEERIYFSAFNAMSEYIASIKLSSN